MNESVCCPEECVKLPVCCIEIPGMNIHVDPSELSCEGKTLDYSFAEQWTGRHWIDGKKVYVKTVDLGLGPNTSTKEVAHGIENLQDMVELSGIAIRPGQRYCLVLPHPYPTDKSIYLHAKEDHLYLRSLSDRTDMHCYAYVRYTCTDR